MMIEALLLQGILKYILTQAQALIDQNYFLTSESLWSRTDLYFLESQELLTASPESEE